jgi:hypothetical protein
MSVDEKLADGCARHLLRSGRAVQLAAHRRVKTKTRRNT